MSRPYLRQGQVRATGPKFLIVCEGDGEKALLEAVRQDLRLTKDQIIVLNGKGTDPLTIVRTVVGEQRGLRQEGRWLAKSTGGVGWDTAWVALDGDEHRDNNRDNWHQALDLAQANDVKVAVSNPSLELWYLLYYQNQEAYIHRDKAAEELEKYAPHYKKPMSIYPGPPGALSAAIGRAARLTQRNRENDKPFHTNPCSGMGELVERLLRLKDKFSTAE